MHSTAKLGALVAALVVAGCADRGEPAAPAAASSAQSALIDRDDPYGLDAMVRAMSAEEPRRETLVNSDIHVKFMGKGNLVADPPTMPLEEILDRTSHPDDPKDLPPAAGGPGRFRVFNAVTRNEFQVTISARLLNTINSARVRAGLTSATEGVDDPAEVERIGGVRGSSFDISRAGGFTTTGWSNGLDSRVLITPTTTWPRRAVAQFTYGSNDSRCSGTLIGPRHVITAGHCVVDQGTNNWKTITVTPARNGVGVAPYGSSTISLNPGPGVEAWYFTLDEWRDPSTKNPRQFDWAIIVIPNKLGNSTGWMGYTAESFNALSSTANWNRGYPSCDPTFVEKPAGCQTASMYGDVAQCYLGGFSSPGPDGWNRLLSVSCDLSRGHSGSSVYHYTFDPNLNQSVPVVSMMVVSHTCLTCTPQDTFPKWARRITPADLNTISFFRQTFP
jgi:V8-like Glu-specific endopeptidase